MKEYENNPATYSRYGKTVSISRRSRRWGWLMMLFALAANGLLFGSLSWMNIVPRTTPTHRQYSAIEIFPVQLPPAPPLPVTKAIPTVAETIVPRMEMETTEFGLETETFAPRMADWLPQLPLVQVPTTLHTIEIPAANQAPKADLNTPARPMQWFQVDRIPKKISGRFPAYPYWARAKGVEGVVTLRFVVDRNGNVTAMEVDRVIGDPRFAETAREAVSTWTFSPALYNARPVAVWCIQTIQFKLD